MGTEACILRVLEAAKNVRASGGQEGEGDSEGDAAVAAMADGGLEIDAPSWPWAKAIRERIKRRPPTPP